jgi:hypothetical protein
MPLELSAIDGKNPLGFVAALGVIASLGGKLHWRAHGSAWLPIVSELDASIDEPNRLADALYEHLHPDRMPFAYTLAIGDELPYDDFKAKKSQTLGSKRRSREVRIVTEEVFRRALDACIDRPDEQQRLAAHTCAVALREGAVTAVRSVSGQVRYLSNLRAVVRATKREDIERALFGKWQYRQGTPKLGLDPSTFVGNVPIDIGQLGSIGEIGAERLALEGLRALPTSIHNGHLVTRGYDHNGSHFRWALSAVPRSLPTSSDLLAAPQILSEGESLRAWMRANGVAAVFKSPVHSYGQGYRVLRPAVAV